MGEQLPLYVPSPPPPPPPEEEKEGEERGVAEVDLVVDLTI